MVNSVTPIPTPPIANAKIAAPTCGALALDVGEVWTTLLMCLLFKVDAGWEGPQTILPHRLER